MMRAADHSWICCQLALTAGETFDEFVPANVHCANIAKGTQLHWHMLIKHLHMNKELHSVSLLPPAQGHRNQFYWENVVILFSDDK